MADEADFNCANETATSLSKLNTSLPSTNGKLQEWLGYKDLSSFSTDIVILAGGLMEYAKGINGFSSAAENDDFRKAESTAESLGNLSTSLPSTNGKLQEWLGYKDLSSFSTDIVTLAGGLMEYAKGINGFSLAANENDFKNAETTAESLGRLSTSLPSTNGKLQEWLGYKDLSSFSKSIVALASGLMEYAKGINGFSSAANENDFKNAETTAESLGKLDKSLPATGGELQKWLGEQNLEIFSERIVKLSTGLFDYATNIKGFSSLASPEDFSKAEEIAESLSDLNRALPSTGGTLAKWIYGEQDLGLFSTNIALLGTGLRAFAESIAGLSVTETDDAITVMDVIKSFQDELEKTGGIGQMFSEFFEGSTENTLVQQSTTMATFGQNLKTFCDSIIGLSTENVGQAFSVLDTFNGYLADREKSGGLFSSIGKLVGGGSEIVSITQSMADFGTKFSTFATGISGAMEAAQNFSIVQAIVTAFGALAAKVESGEIDLDAISKTALSIGNAFSVAFLGCIADQSYAFEESMISMSTQTSNALKLEQVNWYNAGAYLGQGLANGIASMTGRIKSAAINAAAGASRAISITWQVHSPSRVGFNLGRFFDLGIVGGIDKFSGQIARSAQNVGEQTVDSARTMLTGLDSSIFDNIDPNPTIRPVMDLTSIQNGVRKRRHPDGLQHR